MKIRDQHDGHPVSMMNWHIFRILLNNNTVWSRAWSVRAPRRSLIIAHTYVYIYIILCYHYY